MPNIKSNVDIALKPCPFCGGHVVANKHFKHETYAVVHRCEFVPVSIEFTSLENIQQRWNTRAAKTIDTHLNPASVLPPTRTPLLIEFNGELVKVERTTHVSDRDHDLDYITETGAHISGKYRWTYQ